MHTFLWLAVVLVILWIILKFALALTGAALHLLWIAAIIMLIIWVINMVRGSGRGTPVA